MRLAFLLFAAFAATLTLSLTTSNANDITTKEALNTNTTTIKQDDKILSSRKNEGVEEERVLGLETIKTFFNTKVMSLINRLRAWFGRTFRFKKRDTGTSFNSLPTSSSSPKISVADVKVSNKKSQVQDGSKLLSKDVSTKWVGKSTRGDNVDTSPQHAQKLPSTSIESTSGVNNVHTPQIKMRESQVESKVPQSLPMKKTDAQGEIKPHITVKNRLPSFDTIKAQLNDLKEQTPPLSAPMRMERVDSNVKMKAPPVPPSNVPLKMKAPPVPPSNVPLKMKAPQVPPSNVPLKMNADQQVHNIQTPPHEVLPSVSKIDPQVETRFPQSPGQSLKSSKDSKHDIPPTYYSSSPVEKPKETTHKVNGDVVSTDSLPQAPPQNSDSKIKHSAEDSTKNVGKQKWGTSIKIFFQFLKKLAEQPSKAKADLSTNSQHKAEYLNVQKQSVTNEADPVKQQKVVEATDELNKLGSKTSKKSSSWSIRAPWSQ
ncbi:hypothetical protein Plhal304r1_c049g0131001 [Plasmopara halstedii]